MTPWAEWIVGGLIVLCFSIAVQKARNWIASHHPGPGAEAQK
jgi:hypothetical protein